MRVFVQDFELREPQSSAYGEGIRLYSMRGEVLEPRFSAITPSTSHTTSGTSVNTKS